MSVSRRRDGRVSLSLGEIKELAGVGRPTVSNWRRRFTAESQAGANGSPLPFPEPLAGVGSESKPLFDAEEVAIWLDGRPVPTLVDQEAPDEDGRMPTYGDRLRRRLVLRGLVALKHGSPTSEQLITEALAVTAMDAEAGDWEPDLLPADLVADRSAADPQVVEVVRAMVASVGSPGEVARMVLGLAEDLESDLAMNATPSALAALVSQIVGSVESGPGERSVISLCAGTGDLLFALAGITGHGELVAVEEDPLLRKLLRYRLFSSFMAQVDVCSRPEELDTLRTWEQGPEDTPWGFPAADVVLADPPYVPGERDQEGEDPLNWAMEAVRRLKPGGMACAVVPAWTLSRARGNSVTPAVERREQLLERGCVDVVVQLPRRTHPFRTGAEYVLLVLRPAGPQREVLLVDADRMRRRVGDTWVDQAAELVRAGGLAGVEEARRLPVRAHRPGEEHLLDGRSLLPAHRLAAAGGSGGSDHDFEALQEARRVAYAALPNLRDWLGALGVAKRRSPVSHTKIGTHLTGRQLRLLAGHRIAESDLGSAGLVVIGREEMLGVIPIGQRRIDITELARYPSAMTTEVGDVLILTEHGVRSVVDRAGGCVLLTPVQGVRIAAYADHGADSLWMRPQVLAELLRAPRNQLRSSGSLVRRVSLRDMDLPRLLPEEVDELEAILTETERLRAEVRKQLEALDGLTDRLSAGVANGVLALRKAPRN